MNFSDIQFKTPVSKRYGKGKGSKPAVTIRKCSNKTTTSRKVHLSTHFKRYIKEVDGRLDVAIAWSGKDLVLAFQTPDNIPKYKCAKDLSISNIDFYQEALDMFNIYDEDLDSMNISFSLKDRTEKDGIIVYVFEQSEVVFKKKKKDQ